MRLASFSFEDTVRVGVVVDDEVVDLYLAEPEAPTDMCEFLALGEEGRVMAEFAVERGGNRRPLSDVELLAPVPNPRKFLAVGLNYGDHIAETGAQKPSMPTIFTKQVSCVQRPGGGVHIPLASKAVDYEGELGIVIGETCRHVSAAEAESVIAGYTIVNDVSVRDFQRHTPQFTMGKSFDTHGPVGPGDRDRRRVGQPACARHPDVGEWRAAPGLQHEAPDLQLLRHRRVRHPGDDAGAGRHHCNGDALRGRRGDDSASVVGCGRHGEYHDFRDWDASEYVHAGA